MAIMIRNSEDIWKEDVPIGTFDITLIPNGVTNRPDVNASIIFVCPNGRRCSVFMGPACVDKSNTETEFSTWKWDNNLDKPSLHPSINCLKEKDGKPRGGCGWHGWIINGEIK